LLARLRLGYGEAMEEAMKWDIDLSAGDIRARIVFEEDWTEKSTGFTAEQLEEAKSAFEGLLHTFGWLFLVVLTAGPKTPVLSYLLGEKLERAKELIKPLMFSKISDS